MTNEEKESIDRGIVVIDSCCKIKNKHNNEREIGERFDYNGVTLEVVKDDKEICDGCYFQYKPECCDNLCSYIGRTDRNSVIFKEVKTKIKNVL